MVLVLFDMGSEFLFFYFSDVYLQNLIAGKW